MMRQWVIACGAAALATGTALAQHANHADEAAPRQATILTGYGNGGFPITTDNKQAQAFFDNGMQLDAAFAHPAAIQAMKEAVRLDPQCAMCVWGEAWVSGPTINFGKSEAEIDDLYALVQKADKLAATRGTDRERALIAAMKLRYKDQGRGTVGPLAFAKAMTTIANTYPDDKQVNVMAATAWMMTDDDSDDVWPINARMAMPMLERVLKQDPNYTPAIHFYIHAAEIADQSAKAEPYADKLIALAPSASHLVHMPSHTYYWVGRYADAARANKRAVDLGIENARRLGIKAPDGVWNLPYHGHNVTFGVGGALMGNTPDVGLALARPLVDRAAKREDNGENYPIFSLLGYAAMAKFAPADEVLALPKPRSDYVKSAWHYARGEVFAARGDLAGLQTEVAAIRGVSGKVDSEDGSLQAAQIPLIARQVLVGRAAMIERRYADAANAFRAAAEIEESSVVQQFSDPPIWYYPVRRDLAATLLAAGDVAGARTEAQAALKFRMKDPVTEALLVQIDNAQPAHAAPASAR